MFKLPSLPRLPLPFGLFLASLLLALGGCGTAPDEFHSVLIAGGEIIKIPIGPHGPRPGQANGYQVDQDSIGHGAQTREILYQFGFTAPPGASLQQVQVDDVSDETAYPLIDDQRPKLKDNRWYGESASIDADNPCLAWVLNISPSLRIYRFTITDSAGQRSVLYQTSVYGDYVKSLMRKSWGEKY